MHTKRIAKDSRRSGSILLIVLVTMSALSLFALAATDNTRTLLDASTLERRAMRADATADSAVAYVDKQLALDEDWSGTSGWVSLGSDERFRAAQVATPDPMQRHFIVEAEAGEATVKLRAEFHVDRYTAPILQHALATLGGNVDLNNVNLSGDILVVDTQGGVKDYNPVTGEWETRDSGGDPAVTSGNNMVDGDLMTYSGSMPGVTYTGENQQMFAPIINPTWNLDSFLLPGPDRIISTDTDFSGLVTDKTLVINAPMGSTIRIQNSVIRGGVVVWSPPDWPQRGNPYNKMRWSSNNFGLPSSDPASTNIGMIAPGTALVHGNNENFGQGLFTFFSVRNLNNADITGSLWVVNEVQQMNNVSVTYDPALKSVAYEGMGYNAIYTPFDGVAEYHDEPVTLVQ